MIFCSCVISGGLRPAGGRDAVQASGQGPRPAHRLHPSGTNTDCQIKFELTHILDFSGIGGDGDTIAVSATGYSLLDAPGATPILSYITRDPGTGAVTGGPVGTDAQFVYNETNGQLLYDTDGSGVKAAFLIAVLQKTGVTTINGTTYNVFADLDVADLTIIA
jgi:hypothetical protein